MDPFQGISAEIISNGQALELYDDPDATDNEDGYSRHQYAEAVAGSTFQVKVNLAPDMNLYRLGAGHSVSMGIKIDTNQESAVGTPIEGLQKYFSRGRLEGHTFTGCRQFCTETGQWMLCDYAFGDLVLNESSDPGFSFHQAQDLGRIQVIVRRVKLVKRNKASSLNTIPIVTVHEVPEKALKGRPIDTTVRLANARPTAAPSDKAFYKPVSGEAGKPVVFNIYYRSKRALQILGIIPRTPSPEVRISMGETTASKDVVQEVQDLRARLALLERGLNLKPEPSGAAKRLKRERDDDEGNDGCRQKRRTSVKVEHIDLTDD